jgi:catechol-2,3-dioxygenase
MDDRMLTPAPGPVPVTLSHVVLRTAHLDEVIEWYGKVIGTHANYRSAHGAALSNDGEHHRIALAAVPPAEIDRMAPGLEHLAFKLQNLEALLSNHLRLQADGIVPVICINHTGTVSFYYADPDGVQVELFIDALVADAAIAHMGTDEFTSNPIGSPFDPAELVRRYRDGEPLASLLEAPPFDPALLEAAFGDRSPKEPAPETVEAR